MSGLVVSVVLYFILKAISGNSGNKKGVGSGFLWAILWLFGVIDLAVSIPILWGGFPWAIPFLIAGIHVVAPWLVARHLYLPLGLVWPAYFAARLSGRSWGNSSKAAAIVAGAGAALRLPEASPRRAKMSRWLRKQLESTLRFDGALAVAYGLCARLEGERGRAQAYFNFSEEFHKSFLPRPAQRVAREILAVDAFAQENWEALAEVALREGRSSSLTQLLGELALLRLERIPFRRLRLFRLWLIAPHRRTTHPYLKRAFEFAGGDARQAAAPELPIAPRLRSTSGVSSPVTEHVIALRNLELNQEDLSRLFRAWESVELTGDLANYFRLRAATLGAKTVETALNDFLATAGRDIVEFAAEGSIQLEEIASESQLLASLSSQAVAQLEEQVELQSEALKHRVEAGRFVSAEADHAEFVALRDSYEEAVVLGGKATRHALFQEVHYPVSALACSLFNDRGQRGLGHVIFKWCLKESLAVGTQEDITLNSKNVEAGND